MGIVDSGPVVVAGAGPTGLVTALELARRGIPVRIVDALVGPSPGSRATSINPRSLELFHDLGIVEKLIARGRSRIALRRYLGTQVLATKDPWAAGPEPSPDTPFPRALTISQRVLEDLLRDRLRHFGVTVEYRSRLAAFSQNDDEVYAHLRSSDGESRIRTPYLIGCDGADSAVRAMAGIGFVGTRHAPASRTLVGDVVLDGLDRDFWHVWQHRAGQRLSLFPAATSDQFQIQVDLPDGGESLSTAQLQALVAELTGRGDIGIESIGWQSIWSPDVRMVDRYREGRVFLAGDAAHVHVPILGFSLNHGVQDAYNLGWKIANVLRGAPAELLDSYQAERLPVAARALGLDEPTSRKETVAAQPAGGPSDLNHLDVGYRTGPLTREIVAAYRTLRPGDRAPDACISSVGQQKRRLFDLFRGTRVIALAFGVKSRQVASTLTKNFPADVRSVSLAEPDLQQEYPFIVTVRDVLGSSRRAYDADGDTLFIIRPDGYVAGRYDGPVLSTVRKHLALFLPPPEANRAAYVRPRGSRAMMGAHSRFLDRELN